MAKCSFRETKIQQYGSSLGRIAVKIASLKTQFTHKNITIVGSGQIGNVVLTAIREICDNTRINIISNNQTNIFESEIVFPYDKVADICATSDIVFFCSSNNIPIITDANYHCLDNCELVFDLGFPRNCMVSDNCERFVFLEQVVEFGRHNNIKRIEEAAKVEKLIERELINVDSQYKRYLIDKISSKHAHNIASLSTEKARLAYTIEYTKKMLNGKTITELIALLHTLLA